MVWILSPKKRAAAKLAARQQADHRKKLIRMRRYGPMHFLIMGLPESGKSTLIKQMRMLYGSHYTKDERVAMKPRICRYTIRCMRTVLEAMGDYGFPMDDPKRKADVNLVLGASLDDLTAISPDLSSSIENLWEDKIIQEFANQPREYKILPGTEYFLDNVRRIAVPEFVPNIHDVLLLYEEATQPIAETDLVHQLDCILRVMEFDPKQTDVESLDYDSYSSKTLIYVIDLSKYDQPLQSDPSRTELHEAIRQCGAVLNSNSFYRSTTFFFMNKVDLFKDKLKKVPLKEYFPEYDGGDDFKDAAAYILELVLATNERQERNWYAHFSNATDPLQARLIMSAVSDTIFPVCNTVCMAF